MVMLLRIWAVIAICAMGYAAVQTSLIEGWAVAGRLMSYWWFNATLLDVYLGLALFSFWVIYKCSDSKYGTLRGIAWVVFFVMTGNIGTGIYLLIELLAIPTQSSGRELAVVLLLKKSHAEKLMEK